MSEQGYEQLTLFPEGFLANPLAYPGSDEARKMTVSSGLKCSVLLKNSGPVGLLGKMLLGSSIWNSTTCFLTWKAKATKRGRLYFQLVPSTPRTDETGFLLWPTPTARDCKGANSVAHLTRPGGKNHKGQLANAVRLFPTPKAQNALGAGQRHGSGGPSLDVVVGGQLNPTWVEWLMGFPVGWTDLEALEMP